MLDYDQALALIAAIEAPAASERVPLAAAAGRVLAADVALGRDQPGFDRATMDGYALRLDGERDRFEVVGTVHAGETAAAAPRPGQALRIMTGAPCPPGVTVVPIESTDGGAQTVTVHDPAALRPGRNIAFRGEDGHAGDRIVAAGTRLTPAVLAAAAMGGATELAVHPAPRLAVVTTGDEVGAAGEAGIADSNGPLLAAIAGGLALPCARHHAADDAADLRTALETAAADGEIVVTTGGVSAGDRDLVPPIAAELGFEQILHKVAIQPGKPVFLARRADGRCLLGLPGNPVSVLATAHLFLAPLVGRFQGGWSLPWLRLPVAAALAHRKPRELFQPARLTAGGVVPMAWNGSGDLLCAAAADGLVRLVPGITKAAGEPVRFLPYLGTPLGSRGLLPPRETR